VNHAKEGGARRDGDSDGESERDQANQQFEIAWLRTARSMEETKHKERKS